MKSPHSICQSAKVKGKVARKDGGGYG